MKKLIVFLLALLLATPAQAIMMIGFGGGASGIAFDADSDVAAGTGDLSWTHTPVGTPKGIVVHVVQYNSNQDYVANVTYGGVAMTEVLTTGKSTGEQMKVWVFHLGTSIPTGAQTVLVGSTFTTTKKAYAVSVTAAGDTSVTDTTTISSDSVENPSGTLSLGGVDSFCVHGGISGQDDPANHTSPAGWTDLTATDFSTQTAVFEYYDTVASDDVIFGQTQSAEDFVSIGIAIREAP